MSGPADRSYAVRYAQKRAFLTARFANAARNQNQTTGTPITSAGGAASVGQDAAVGRRRIWREYNPAQCAGALPGGQLTYSVNPPNAEGDGCCDPPGSEPVLVVG
jgi:hypothetical protein